MDLMGLEQTLKDVTSLQGVAYLGMITNAQPIVNSGERLLAVQGQYVKARVMDVTMPDWYNSAHQDYYCGMAPETHLLRVREEALEKAIDIFGMNLKISFLFPDIGISRPGFN